MRSHSATDAHILTSLVLHASREITWRTIDLSLIKCSAPNTRKITDTKHATKMSPLALIFIAMSFETSLPNFSQLTLAFSNVSLLEIFLIEFPQFFRFVNYVGTLKKSIEIQQSFRKFYSFEKINK